MILTFAVENFRSILNRQEITFVASRFKGHDESLHATSLVSPGILPALAFYGANAAGKTNLIKALDFFSDAVRYSHNTWKPNEKIAHNPHFLRRNDAAVLEVEFLLKGRQYRYGFSFTSEVIEKEWLYSGRSLLFNRERDEFKFGARYKGSKALRAQTRQTSLFLSTAAQNNHPLLSELHQWIARWHVVDDDIRYDQIALASIALNREPVREFMVEAMRAIDAQITAIIPAAEKEDGFSKTFPEDMRSMARNIELYSGTKITHKLKNGETLDLPLPEESRGTQTYFHLIIPVITSLISGRPLFVDEIDSSLHPMLLRAIVKLFQDKRSNPLGSQLVFNTHDTTLLTTDLLRPDQIWFVEKGEETGTEFVALADFEGVRSDIRVQRAYLEGRFGAIPFVENLIDVFAAELTRVGVGSGE